MPRLTHASFALALAVFATTARAENLEIRTAPGITLDQVGIFCTVQPNARVDAPETDLGYIQLVPTRPQLVFEQQEVPARLGIMFGIVATSDRDIAEVRIVTIKPGDSEPDAWYTSYTADRSSLRAFSFDFSNELVPGLWLLQAYDGDQQLYSVPFQVVPGTELVGISSNCNLLS